MDTTTSFAKPLLLCGVFVLTACSEQVSIDNSGPIAGWTHYGGGPGGGHFSPATQITPENVHALEVAWVYRSGDFNDGGNYRDGMNPPDEPVQSSFEVTPILVNDRLYICTPYNRVIALNPETGVELWAYDPELEQNSYALRHCRGVSHWRDSEAAPGQACRDRIISGTGDGRLLALDADTGKACTGFGKNGQVDLHEGLGEHELAEYGLSSPPAIIDDRIIVGGSVSDNVKTTVPGGVVRAYDVRTGLLDWYWDPIPPGQEPVLDDAGDQRYQRGTTNVWSIISVDPDLGLIYLPTGNTSPDYYGGHRDGLDYYSSSVVALFAETGEVAWHFQTVHHDIWDYDVPAQPTFFEFEKDGQTIKALAQATKTGNLFLLNRETGEPLFPVEEREVPQGAVAGDFTAPTQPFPTKPAPLHPTTFTPDDAWGFTFWDRGVCRDAVESLRSEGLFTPPSLQGSIHYPSAAGGNNWGSPAVDPQRRLLVINTLRMASIIQLIPRDECDAAEIKRQADPLASRYGAIEPQEGTPYCDLRWISFFSPLGVPCTPPPWGTLTGIDLQSGEHVWEVPLGTSRDIAPFPFWYIDGAPNIGGPLVTASGLTFIGATTDHYIRAFSTETGEELWKARLPTAAHATPMSYRLSEAGRQYVVIAAGGHFALGTPAGDHLTAYALKGN
ncbi:MAG: pyrroloquinoline quinone-dependent dehydrogenase [Gammaproteobacteria bacterium]|nr:pyrroloquinoline quinone-dependent dehydrogenase [Gammaproteobacteria bacterium]